MHSREDFIEDAVAINAAEGAEAIQHNRRGHCFQEFSVPLFHFGGVAFVKAPDDIKLRLLVIHEFDESVGEYVIPPAIGSDNQGSLLGDEQPLQGLHQLGAGIGQLRLCVERVGIAPESVQVHDVADSGFILSSSGERSVRRENPSPRPSARLADGKRDERVKVCGENRAEKFLSSTRNQVGEACSSGGDVPVVGLAVSRRSDLACPGSAGFEHCFANDFVHGILPGIYAKPLHGGLIGVSTGFAVQRRLKLRQRARIAITNFIANEVEHGRYARNADSIFQRERRANKKRYGTPRHEGGIYQSCLRMEFNRHGCGNECLGGIGDAPRSQSGLEGGSP